MKKGFRLIKVIIVVVLLGLFISFLTFRFIAPATDSAKALNLSMQLKTVETALSNYFADTGTYPCNIRFLWENPSKIVGDGTATTSNMCYDSVSLIAGAGAQDADVLTRWSGPYLTSPAVMPGAPDVLQAALGQGIIIGASITKDGEVKPLVNTANPEPAATFMNVLVVTGLEESNIQAVYKSVNGNSIDGKKAFDELSKDGTGGKAGQNFADAYDVASSKVDYKLGVSKYGMSSSLYVVYRFTGDFRGVDEDAGN
ncbi:type II secretion system GspH family protein [Campylobacter geochelonis]|uniref:type II secretion system GspH family protein n=1 Tax=Campylobacter geochelonis TaxID=1780362 RepID=UPI00077079FA|nr:type II secretion system GspH family protein [Campylobacter geochelonis]CZE50345.1 type II secretion system protein G [Campylobacter geochelonis]